MPDSENSAIDAEYGYIIVRFPPIQLEASSYAEPLGRSPEPEISQPQIRLCSQMPLIARFGLARPHSNRDLSSGAHSMTEQLGSLLVFLVSHFSLYFGYLVLVFVRYPQVLQMLRS